MAHSYHIAIGELPWYRRAIGELPNGCDRGACGALAMAGLHVIGKWCALRAAGVCLLCAEQNSACIHRIVHADAQRNLYSNTLSPQSLIATVSPIA